MSVRPRRGIPFWRGFFGSLWGSKDWVCRMLYTLYTHTRVVCAIGLHFDWLMTYQNQDWLIIKMLFPGRGLTPTLTLTHRCTYCSSLNIPLVLVSNPSFGFTALNGTVFIQCTHGPCFQPHTKKRYSYWWLLRAFKTAYDLTNHVGLQQQQKSVICSSFYNKDIKGTLVLGSCFVLLPGSCVYLW